MTKKRDRSSRADRFTWFPGDVTIERDGRVIVEAKALGPDDPVPPQPDLARPAPEGTVPARFRFTEAGYLEGGATVELAGDVLLRRPVAAASGGSSDIFFDTRHTREVRPSPDDWRAFCRALDRLGVWSWEPSYEDPDIIDGGWWELSIAWSEHSLESWGRNAYPRGWCGFLRALHRLTREAGWFEVDGKAPPSSAVMRRWREQPDE